MQTRDYARAALWDTAIKFSLQSRAITSPDHLEIVKTQNLSAFEQGTEQGENNNFKCVIIKTIEPRTRGYLVFSKIVCNFHAMFHYNKPFLTYIFVSLIMIFMSYISTFWFKFGFQTYTSKFLSQLGQFLLFSSY